MHTNPRTLRRLLPLVLLTLLPLGACGGSDGSGDSGGSGNGDGVASVDGDGDGGAAEAAEADPVEEAQLFAECLRENGVDVPDPDPETGEIDFQAAVGNGDRDALMVAFEACRDLAPDQLMEERAEPTDEQFAAMEEFAVCMRENGVDLPDPEPGVGFQPGAVDPSVPGWDEALASCEEHLTALGRG
ncbi:hypothetical protein [Streptomyces specialis]|uniref:hypothetical protein n=1 Tax=Streptomyces specialis TaxID=498367 RepID=UPI00073FA251|nr:hypothetical protein [Streptomyces specialis]